jgi:hypothetical protein
MTDVARTAECQCEHCLARAQKRHVRMWRGLATLDLTKPPVPVLRWTGIALTGIIYAAAGAPTRLGDWLWAAIIGGALLLPDIAGFGVAGVRVDLRKTQEDIATLRNEVSSRSSATANITIAPDVFQSAIRASFRAVQAEHDVIGVYESPKKPEAAEGEGYIAT